MNKFKIGDRIITLTYDGPKKGSEGTIINISERTRIGVEFDKPFVTGHDCQGKGKNKFCWNCERTEVKLIKSKTSIGFWA